MGLLDFKMPDMDSAQGQGLLAAAFSLMGAKGNSMAEAIGSAGRDYMATYGTARNAQEAAALRNLQAEQARLQLQEMKRKADDAERQRQWSAKLPEVMNQKIYGASDVGPTMAPDTAAVQNYLLNPDSPYRDKLMEKSLFPEKPEAYTLGEGQVRYQGNQIVAQGPAKVTQEPDQIRQLKAIYGEGTPAYNAALQRLGIKMTTHQPSTVVNTGDSLGLKPKDRFEMENKLRGDYESIVKDDNNIVSVAQDINSLLKTNGALKDQAAIYKFAKSLDPQGAVREADYAAIVRTAGGLDYVTALVNKALTGEQLSPKQRQEMGSLVDGMAKIAQKRIAIQQKRFSNNAKMYNLDPNNLFVNFSSDGWSLEK